MSQSNRSRPKRRNHRLRLAQRGIGGNPSQEPSSRVSIYRGPIRLRGAQNEADLHTVVLTQEFSLTSSAGGVLAPVLPDEPNAAANWANFVNCFDEYRVLAFEAWYMPNNRYSKTATVTTPLMAVVDHDTNTALSSYSLAAQYASVKEFALDDPWKYVARMSEVSEAGFLNTAAPAARYFIKLYSTGLSVSTTYGQVIVSYRVQFRGTGL